MRHLALAAVAAAIAAVGLMATTANAQKRYDPGASDTEITIGNIAPYSGPASAYGVVARTQAAYFKMINAQGGINGRKINFISYDDAFSPPKTVEQARKLVEGDEVLLLFSLQGTPTNLAIQKYVNQRQIPHLFIGSGAARWSDYRNFPWSMGWLPSYQVEARIYAKYILDNHPGKTVGILFQNDDFGKDYLTGFNEIFGENKSKIVVAEVPFNVTEPTVDSQIVRLKASNPDIFINIASAKFAAMAIKKIGELNWRPIQIVTNISTSVASVIRPAGLQNAHGMISAVFMKDPDDADAKTDPAMAEWRTFMTRYFPEGDQSDRSTVYGYGVAKALEQVLKQCGDDLTRANVMKQAANLDMDLGVLLPGIRIKTGPADYIPIDQLQLMRFAGEKWERFGPIIGGGNSP